MTPHQVRVATALARCKFLPGSADKRFAHDMASRAQLKDPPALSERQGQYLKDLAYKYRRQMPADLVPSGSAS